MNQHLTYNQALSLLRGYVELSSFTNQDGKECSNHFGLYHVKIAQSIQRLKKVEAEYVALNNELITARIPSGAFEVPQEKRAEVQTLNFELLKSECGLSLEDLAKLPQDILEASGNKVSLQTLSLLGDVIVWNESN